MGDTPSFQTDEFMTSLGKAEQDFYQDFLPLLQEGQEALAAQLEQMQKECAHSICRDPLDHWKFRVKTADSAKRKLGFLGLPSTPDAAVHHLHDVIGARVVCTFVDDIYRYREWFFRCPSMQITEEKDYVRRPKANGYRSCHLIVRIPLQDTGILAEIQLRTLAMDCWAVLEHQLKYKNDRAVHPLMIQELKRCSDEIASTDWNLLAIREMVEDHQNSQDKNLPGGIL